MSQQQQGKEDFLCSENPKPDEEMLTDGEPD